MRLKMPTETLYKAEFEIWVPERIQEKIVKPRGVVVLSSGSNSDGAPFLHSKSWRKWAEAEDVVLISTFFMDKNPSGIEGYCRANEESGSLLMWAIREFQHELKLHLEGVKLYLWGFSAGGQFSYEFNAAFPERVGGFVLNKGGIYYTALAPALARKNPGLLIIGEKDSGWRKSIVKGIFAVNLVGDAPWEFIEEKDKDHELGKSIELGQNFFSKILPRRDN